MGGLLGRLFAFTFLPHLWYFGLGIFWYFLRRRVDISGRWATIAGLLYVGSAALNQLTDGVARQALSLWTGAVLSCVVVWIGDHGPRAMMRLTRRIGDLSYGVYIWHMIVVNAFLWWDVPAVGRLGSTVTVGAVLATSLLLARLSWRFVERPALALKRRSSGPPSKASIPLVPLMRRSFKSDGP